MQIYHYFPGKIPIVVSIPHAGTYIPEHILGCMTQSSFQLPDTDWHVEKLYSFARELNVHFLIATHSRYVIDLNRAPDGQSLYQGKFTTDLCPLSTFNGASIYLENKHPNKKEIEERLKIYWQPYHQKLQSIINELKSHHQRIIIFDAHSIRSEVPLLFDGVLPDLNLGTYDGISAHVTLTNELMLYLKNQPYSLTSNARFKGGYITRKYGNPREGINAIQLELAQHNYMLENYPFSYIDEKAKQLQQTLQGFFEIMIRWI